MAQPTQQTDLKVQLGHQPDQVAAARQAVDGANLEAVETCYIDGYAGAAFPTEEAIALIGKMTALKKLEFYSRLGDDRSVRVMAGALTASTKPVLEEVLLKGDVQGEYSLGGLEILSKTLTSLPNLKKLTLIDLSKYTTPAKKYNEWDGLPLIDLISKSHTLEEFIPPSSLKAGFPRRVAEALSRDLLSEPGCDVPQKGNGSSVLRILLLEQVREDDLVAFRDYFQSAANLEAKTRLERLDLYCINLTKKPLQDELIRLANGVVKLHIVSDGKVVTVG